MERETRLSHHDEPNQFALLKQRRFAPFFWTQFLGAGNDNLFKFAFTVMVTYQLEVSWLTCVRTNNASCATAFNEIGGPVHLVLRITPNVASSTSDTALGVAYLASDGTGRYGDVFWKRAQDLRRNSKVDLASILASVMAHEVGHLLLGSNAHAISGIMQAHWERGELRRISMGSLLFLPEQGKRMRARMTQREHLLMSRSERPRD